jgi:hypothetical protein
MNIGYAFWGFLGDKKYDEKYNEISTPDGNAFYSWSIVKAFVDAGHKVCNVMTDRDIYGFSKKGKALFASWCTNERYEAYTHMVYNSKIVLDVILLEWRWEVKGRNELRLEGKEGWQPDLLLRNKILKKAEDANIPVIVFDLDYKLTEEDIKKYKIKYVIELGNKWSKSKLVKSKKVFIPFDFGYINEFRIRDKPDEMENQLVYIGNRYERDWCIDKYIPEWNKECVVYGNWKEAGRDSEKVWSDIQFRHRLQTSEMYEAYSRSAATILLAKEEYCKMGFMTARIIESVFYGCIPLFIREYGSLIIKEYTGIYDELLTVKNKEEVDTKVEYLKNNLQERKEVIQYLRRHLSFMDCKFFVRDVLELLKEE